MFRTDLNHFLQSFDSQPLHQFMEIVSFMGTVYMLLLTILILIGGVNVRKGFLVLNILGWGVLFMLGAKNYFDYPRPLAVDATLESFGRDKTPENLVALQPTRFFEGFSDELLLKTRTSKIMRHGLPSSHTMIITAVWLGMALLFRKKWLCVVSVSLITLTIISRMYLGMHYLGDVSLGLVLGLIFSIGFNKLYKLTGLKEEFSTSKITVLFLAAPVILAFLYSVIPGFQAGALIGLNLGLLLILRIWGEPVLVSSSLKRMLNTLVFVTLYFSMFFLSKKLHLPKEGLMPLLIFSFLNFVTLILSFYLGKLMGVFTISKA